ncbi:hypothetical protein EDD22DRAFT_917974 [Suillus occidentalis]|nr:hypothetical protein EDD22DRAFT_917974 [Suillus occidentalis]
MSSQHGVRFHDPPATECTSMDVDEPSESQMSLDLDSDSGSSAGLDVLDEIPAQSHPVQGDDLSLLDAPDMYLGPEDDLIEFDDGPAMPDSPMTVNESMPEPCPASPDVQEAPIPFQTIVDRLGDYHQHYGRVPDPTVVQLLEADRPFWTAWADTSDKLRKADADLWRMQRVRDSTSKLLKVLDTLISSFEDQLIM